MEITEKVMKKIMDIIEIDGFHITSKGDPSVGIQDAEWELSHKFYFDNQKELDDFKESLYQLFENYCGEINIETFNERTTQIKKEEREQYQQYPTRYLIKSKGYNNSYMQVGRTGVYSGAIGDAIHMELPHWMTRNSYNDDDDDIIESTDPEFRKILLKAAGHLENEIRNEEYSLRNAKRNLALINFELNYGK